MNKDQLIHEINTTEINLCCGPGVLQLCIPFLVGFVRMKKYYKHYHHYVFNMFHNEYIEQGYSWSQHFKIIKQLYDNKADTLKIRDQWMKEKPEFYKSSEKLLEGLNKVDDKELNRRYQEYFNNFCNIWTAPLSVDAMGIYTDTELINKFMFATKLDRKQAQKHLAELCHPPHISFMGKENISLLKLTLLFKKEGNSEKFKKQLKQHQQSFYWIENNYRYAKVLDEKYFMSKIMAEREKTDEDINREIEKIEDMDKIKKAQDKLFQEIKMPNDMKEDILFTQQLGIWQDHRKEMNILGNHYVNEFMKEVAERLNLPLFDASFLTPEEIAELMAGKPDSRSKMDDERRRKLQFRTKKLIHLLVQPEENIYFEGKDAQDIFDAVRAKEKSKDIRGVTASFGKDGGIPLKGKVKVILDVSKGKIEPGEILVASMTRPEYLPFMKKAAAIITDEGGMTSHAAIVSRELGIPCIIGTKVASKVLKTGMEVEVFPSHGKVKIIKGETKYE